jgi:hypothetical protein
MLNRSNPSLSYTNSAMNKVQEGNFLVDFGLLDVTQFANISDEHSATSPYSPETGSKFFPRNVGLYLRVYTET